MGTGNLQRTILEEVLRLKHYIINLDTKVDKLTAKLGTSSFEPTEKLIESPFTSWDSFIQFDKTLDTKIRFQSLVREVLTITFRVLTRDSIFLNLMRF